MQWFGIFNSLGIKKWRVDWIILKCSAICKTLQKMVSFDLTLHHLLLLDLIIALQLFNVEHDKGVLEMRNGIFYCMTPTASSERPVFVTSHREVYVSLPARNPTQRSLNTLRPRENGRHFADDIFKCIFVNENWLIPIKISLKFVPKGPINNNPALVQIMAWRRPGDKPLSEPMMVRSATHICVTRPQWVKPSGCEDWYIWMK